jgi:hypothetical protein
LEVGRWKMEDGRLMIEIYIAIVIDIAIDIE